jgi:tRNA-dihydrouridine synthase B
MAGLTHSAFRRLLADFGGYGALFTEMLCGRWLLRERLEASPAAKRRPQEGTVFYQLMIADPDLTPAVMDRVQSLRPCGVDLNCACPAPNVRAVGAGGELFEDPARLEAILQAMRRAHAGPLTVKIRLGKPTGDWRGRLFERLRLFADCGVDAVTLHPRFADEKLRRRARHELLPELCAATRLPLIASGDLHGPEVIRAQPDHFAGVAGLMVGRLAVVQPWIFGVWNGAAPAIEPLEVWQRLLRYVLEDFPPAKAFYRVKAFTRYFARNFVFGHTLDSLAQGARSLEALRRGTEEFLARGPAVTRHPDVTGLD